MRFNRKTHSVDAGFSERRSNESINTFEGYQKKMFGLLLWTNRRGAGMSCKHCTLWPYRMGHRPEKNITEDKDDD